MRRISSNLALDPARASRSRSASAPPISSARVPFLSFAARALERVLRDDNRICCFTGLLDGSDGTRTRDLRRDRPNRARRRPPTDRSNRPQLQALSRRGRLRLAWLSRTSNRRLGHEWPTDCCIERRPSAFAISWRVRLRRSRTRPVGCASLRPISAMTKCEQPSLGPRACSAEALRDGARCAQPERSRPPPACGLAALCEASGRAVVLVGAGARRGGAAAVSQTV